VLVQLSFGQWWRTGREGCKSQEAGGQGGGAKGAESGPDLREIEEEGCRE